MIVIKHTKLGAISYVSHIDTMRVLQRSLERAKIDVIHSEGFNPHPLTFCSQPLSLGIMSECEYFVVSNKNGEANQLLEKFNASTPNGIKGLRVWTVVKNPNIVGKSVKSEYVATCEGIEEFSEELESIAKLESLIITFIRKGEEITQDIASLIYEIKVIKDKIIFTLASGNLYLRPDRFINFIKERFGLNISVNSIVRTCQYVIYEDKIMPCDDYLEMIKAD